MALGGVRCFQVHGTFSAPSRAENFFQDKIFSLPQNSICWLEIINLCVLKIGLQQKN